VSKKREGLRADLDGLFYRCRCFGIYFMGGWMEGLSVGMFFFV
jgi:hypothetical protein